MVTQEPSRVRLLLTISEAAAALALSRSYVYELVQCGDITTIKIGRSRRIPVAALEEFVVRHVKEQCA